MKLNIKKLNDSAMIPTKGTIHAAGYDLYASVKSNVKIKPGHVKLISTGLSIELPVGYEAQIRPRSGLALKKQIGILNSPGTIDADYRGEIKIIVHNFGIETFVVEPKMRIAQMVISKHESVEFDIVNELTETERNDGGFGHTGIVNK